MTRSPLVLLLSLLLAGAMAPTAWGAESPAQPLMTPDGGQYYGVLVDGKLQGKGRAEWANGANYEGEFRDGLFSGSGRFRYPTGEVYEGDFRLGLPAGQGRLTTKDGDVFSGEFKDGALNGLGRQVGQAGVVYEGGFKSSLYDGAGKLSNQFGEYTGEFRSGEYAGEGELQFKDGRKYVGGFVHGRFEGKGRLVYPSGVVYEGDFVGGDFSGQGVAVLAGGAKHVGAFLKWKPEGQGVFTDKWGNRYEGVFKEGSIVGTARLESKEGWFYEGEFKDWRPSGRGTLRRPNGDVYVGGFAYGEFDGEGTLTYAKAQADGRTVDSGAWKFGRFKKVEDEKKQRERANVEAALYSQPELMKTLAAQLAARDPERINLFFLGIAGDGSQEVFRREVEFIRNQFDTIYGTQGHSLALINSRNTVSKAPLATLTSIRQAVGDLAERMDKEKDVLFLYVTSHGSKEGEISLGLPGIELPGLTPTELKSMLKQSGVRWRVLLISSCYAGTFINELKDPNTLIITAARHDRTSFGCADENDFTFFGRAFFKEALPKAASFDEAFANAKQLIADWEDQDIEQNPSDKKKDSKKDAEHHSLPQIVSPAPIRSHLQRWWGQFRIPPATRARAVGQFADRVARAKQLEELQETQTYFSERMFPAIGTALAEAIRDCSADKEAAMNQVAVVADISPDGALSNIDHEPKTLAAVCLADAVAGFQVPPPPVQAGNRMPIVIEIAGSK
ncbi:MAG: hypothetical protein D3M94_05165 [Rhodocyclales bacterium GT-UBC]|nr:MAG: hypothetical protein D3M94_05165 [Rhodocyclales bacterium GT-UBC]